MEYLIIDLVLGIAAQTRRAVEEISARAEEFVARVGDRAKNRPPADQKISGGRSEMRTDVFVLRAYFAALIARAYFVRLRAASFTLPAAW